MLKSLVVTVALALMLPAVAACAGQPPRGEGEPQPAAAATRVLIVGDSVTQGDRGDYTWRYFLWKSLRPGAADFVGPRRGTFATEPNGKLDWDYRGADAYADPDFDQDHAALAGARLVRPLGPDNPELYFYEPIGPLCATYHPDVIMALWGVNDLKFTVQTAGSVIAAYREWVASARRVNSDVDFVIGQLPHTWVKGVPAFNRKLIRLARADSTSSSRIVIAELREPYTRKDTVDRVHPSVSGQRKIARMMGAALTRLEQ